jgi:hypothetical protein
MPVIGVTATQNVPINIEVTSAPILIAISVSGQVPTNVMAMTAIGEQCSGGEHALMELS